jgi:hypothetical protein
LIQNDSKGTLPVRGHLVQVQDTDIISKQATNKNALADFWGIISGFKSTIFHSQ